MVAFGGLAFLVSALLAIVCYEVTRATLIRQRERVAERQAFVNARAVDNALTSSPDAPTDALAAAQTSAQGFALLRVGDEWLSSSVTGDPSAVPADLLRIVDDGGAARQRVATDAGTVVAVGVPLVGTTVSTAYVELVPMEEVSATLARVERGLVFTGIATTCAGLLAGWWASGRILRPVRRTAEAANLISQGALDRRLESDGDADLDPLVQSFNQMVDGLQLRIEREARFASDVSHELRTPLASMLAALSVARRRVKEPDGVEALAMLQQETDRFAELITDLLEISRVEAGVAELSLEEVTPAALVAEVLASMDHTDLPVTVEPTAPERFRLDPRRIGQVLVNLVQNADHYAGGVTSVRISGNTDELWFLVDDHGPGIPEDQRSQVFDRFVRGSDPSVPGTGLGLALVKEHVRLHDGSVHVEEAPGGGARFVVRLPREVGA